MAGTGRFPIMTAAGAAGLVASLITGGPWWFCALWLLIIGWIGFTFIWRLPYEVVINDGHLTWRGYRQRRTVPMSDVARMTLAFSGNVQIVECRDGSRLRIGVMQGYAPFIQSVVEEYPDLSIELGRYAGFVEKVRFQRRDKSDGAP